MRMLLRNYHHYLWLTLTIIASVSMVNVFAVDPDDIPPPKSKFNEETLCVEPVDIMRKQHFEFILDHRDRTVVEGIRTTKYSLNACIDCHITPNAQGEYARYSQDTHFCASCHQFAAVTIDCFQCHSDRSEEAIRRALNLNKTVNRSLQKFHLPLQLSDLIVK